MKQEKSCGAIVYKVEDDKPKVLLLKHRYGGHWSFPKGHVEEGENEHQTAFREIEEETGLRVDFKDGFRERVEYFPKPYIKKEVVYFLGEVVDGKEQKQEEEVSEIRWMSLEDVQKYVTYQNDRRLIDKAKKYLIE